MEINQGNPSIKKIKVKTMPHDPAYLLAEKKIEECWRIRERKLHLSDMKLTELPVSIGKCTHLNELNLSNNQLTTLPDSLKQLTQLQELNLSNNQLTVLPESLSELIELRTLWLGVYNGGNPIGHLPIWLKGLNKLEVFGVWNCGLTAIPDWVWEMESLTSEPTVHRELLTDRTWCTFCTLTTDSKSHII